MSTALRHLRDNLAGHVLDRACWRLAERAGEAYGFDAAQVARAGFVGSREALDALEEVKELQALASESCELLKWHVSASRAGLEAAGGHRTRWQRMTEPRGEPAERAPSRLNRALLEENPKRRQAAFRELSRHLAGSAAGWLQPGPVAIEAHRSVPGFDAVRFERQCEELLAATDGPFEELLREQGRRVCGSERMEGQVVFRALRGQRSEGLFSARDRGRRLSGLFAQLGLEAPLSQRVRWAPDETMLFSWPYFEPCATAHDLRVYRAPFSEGALGEVAGLQAVASACAASLSATALPLECVLPTPVSACHGVGGLFAQLFADRHYLRSQYALSGRPLEQAQRQAWFCMLFIARLSCGLSGLFLGEERPTPESGLATLRRVLQWDCEPEVVTMFAQPLEAVVPVAVGVLTGLVLHGPLRERFDEDYFRNPRFGQCLADVMVGGGQLTVFGLATGLDAGAGELSERLAELL